MKVLLLAPGFLLLEYLDIVLARTISRSSRKPGTHQKKSFPCAGLILCGEVDWKVGAAPKGRLCLEQTINRGGETCSRFVPTTIPQEGIGLPTPPFRSLLHQCEPIRSNAITMPGISTANHRWSPGDPRTRRCMHRSAGTQCLSPSAVQYLSAWSKAGNSSL